MKWRASLFVCPTFTQVDGVSAVSSVEGKVWHIKELCCVIRAVFRTTAAISKSFQLFGHCEGKHASDVMLPN